MREYNFDGLIGPTHNYSGLSYGNVASASHRHQVAFPKAAALQGLTKMKTLAGLGIGQAVIPPLKRPDFEFLRSLGFGGSNAQVLKKAAATNPVLLATCFSASSMWTANAATVAPSRDTADGRLQIVVANLSSTLHRSIEHRSTFGNLKQIFADETFFGVSPALPSQPGLADEGAANHTRLSAFDYQVDQKGLALFTYGVDSLARESIAPQKFPARQTKLASESIARQLQLDEEFCLYLQQSPAAIDAGVFHNDVISVGHQNVLLCHEYAFVDQATRLEEVQRVYRAAYDQELYVVEFSNSEISMADAVASYLFNSQLVTRPGGAMTLVCPTECETNAAAKRCTDRLLAEDNPVDQVLFLDLRQSMNNGGGPACLRLRIALTPEEEKAVNPGVLFTDQLHSKLVAWVEKHYRDELKPDDLRDYRLVEEVNEAFEELSVILNMDRCF